MICFWLGCNYTLRQFFVTWGAWVRIPPPPVFRPGGPGKWGGMRTLVRLPWANERSERGRSRGCEARARRAGAVAQDHPTPSGFRPVRAGLEWDENLGSTAAGRTSEAREVGVGNDHAAPHSRLGVLFAPFAPKAIRFFRNLVPWQHPDRRAPVLHGGAGSARYPLRQDRDLPLQVHS